MFGEVDVLRCRLSREQLKVEVRGKEFTTRGLWSPRVLVACCDRSPGVVVREGSRLRSGLGENSCAESMLLRDCGVEVLSRGSWVESSLELFSCPSNWEDGGGERVCWAP